MEDPELSEVVIFFSSRPLDINRGGSIEIQLRTTPNSEQHASFMVIKRFDYNFTSTVLFMQGRDKFTMQPPFHLPVLSNEEGIEGV